MKKFLFFTAFALLSCAPISEKQCVAGNWYELGVRDGARGVLPDRIHKYASSCGEYGISVSREEWEKGRQEGLKLYCTLENAEQVGRHGSNLQPVCQNEGEIRPAYEHGLEYHELEEELEDLQDERDEIRSILRNDFEGELSDEQRALKRRYVRRLDRVDDKIDDVKDELRRFRPYAS